MRTRLDVRDCSGAACASLYGAMQSGELDRLLIEGSPHTVPKGMIVVAHAVGARC